MPKRIPLTQNKFCIVSDEDFDIVSGDNWYAQKLKDDRWYAVRRLPRTKDGSPRPILYMHKYIMGAGKETQVDHINRNSLDNRRENLRFCTHTQNQHNRSKLSTNKSGYIGVISVGTRWSSYITCSTDNGKTKTIHLGIFDDIKEAAEAYDVKAFELRGEFAVLNNAYGKQKQATEEVIEFNDTYQPKPSYSRPKNLTSRNTSGYRGVYWTPSVKQWRAIIKDANTKKTISLGYFLSKNKAAEARNAAEKALYVEHAILNEILPEKDHIVETSHLQRKANTSGFIGVNRVPSTGKWHVSIANPENKTKRISLGDFTSRYEGVIAYNKKAVNLYGNLAVLNDEHKASLLIEADNEFCTELQKAKEAKQRAKEAKQLAKASKQRAKSSSGYKGVYWSKDHNKWCTNVHNPSTKKWSKLGYFSCKHEAALAYNLKAIEVQGKDAAILNKISKSDLLQLKDKGSLKAELSAYLELLLASSTD